MNYMSRELQKILIKKRINPVHILERPKSKTLTPPNAGEDGEQELSFTTAGDTERSTAAVEGSWEVSYSTKQTCPLLTFLGVCPRELKTYVHTKPCTQIFRRSFIFITDKTWKQPRCPVIGKWINELWYIQTVRYYLKMSNEAIKRNGGNK